MEEADRNWLLSVRAFCGNRNMGFGDQFELGSTLHATQKNHHEPGIIPSSRISLPQLAVDVANERCEEHHIPGRAK